MALLVTVDWLKGQQREDPRGYRSRLPGYPEDEYDAGDVPDAYVPHDALEPDESDEPNYKARWEPARAAGDRYRRRRRRTAAEPLRASWQPMAESRPKSKRQRGPLRRLIATFGWRGYAIPVLMAITVFVLVQMFSGGDPSVPRAGKPSETSNTVVAENPAEPVRLDIPTAKLPAGGPYPKEGKGTFHTVPGSGEKVGEGKLYTYTVDVEDGIDPVSFQGDRAFAASVDAILADPRSWAGIGQVALRRVDDSAPPPDFRVTLTSSVTSHRPAFCGMRIPFESSCYRRDLDGGNRVVVNLSRWVRGALAFNADLLGYRQYLINHEVGHALGLGHVGCKTDGALAPVMMQQTFGVANDYVARLNNVPGGDQRSVPADGKTCRPNAWPNPQPNGS